MPKSKYSRSQKWKCSVPNCKSEWMTAQIGKFCFCEDHSKPASDMYHKYKDFTNKSLLTYDSELLKKASNLRKLYSQTFIGKDNPAHDIFGQLLSKLSEIEFENREKTWKVWLEDFTNRNFENLDL